MASVGGALGFEGVLGRVRVRLRASGVKGVSNARQIRSSLPCGTNPPPLDDTSPHANGALVPYHEVDVELPEPLLALTHIQGGLECGNVRLCVQGEERQVEIGHILIQEREDKSAWPHAEDEGAR